MLTIMFSSCQKNQEVEIIENPPNSHQTADSQTLSDFQLQEYESKQIEIFDREGQNHLLIEVRAENKSLIENVDAKDFVYEFLTKEQLYDVTKELNFIDTEDTESSTETEESEVTESVIEVHILEADLQDNVYAYNLMVTDNDSRWLKNYAYYSNGVSGTWTWKTNNSGNTRVKVEILETTNSTWYSKVDGWDKLKWPGDAVSWNACAVPFYKIKLVRDNNWGSSSSFFWLTPANCP